LAGLNTLVLERCCTAVLALSSTAGEALSCRTDEEHCRTVDEEFVSEPTKEKSSELFSS
jgi:hypothetical protein